MIFGLGFATFLTLILVPVMYLISERMKERIKKWRGLPYDEKLFIKHWKRNEISEEMSTLDSFELK
jgi:Na+-transporting methylmalonyl-CoA/oxaloacetate decarboxylase gamma subunit